MYITKEFQGKDGNTYRKNPHDNGKYSYAVYSNATDLTINNLIGYVTTEQARENYIEPSYTFQVTIFNSSLIVVTDSRGKIKEDAARHGCFKKYLAFIRKLYGCENVSYQLIKT